MSDERFSLGFVAGFVALVVVAVILAPGGVGSSGTQVVGQSSNVDGETGFVESRAEETGQESSQQVAKRVEVVGAVGTHVADGSVGVANLTVRRAPGSPPVDLSAASIRVTGPDGTTTLTGDESDGASFGVRPIEDGDGSVPALNDEGDRATIVVDLGTDDVPIDGSGAAASRLAAGERAEVAITTSDGSQTVATITVPDSLGDGPVSLS